MRVTVYGDKLDLADELMEEFHAEAKSAVHDAAALQLAEVKRLLALRRGTPAPGGEPPAEQTQDLLRSFRLIAPRIRGAVASSGWRSLHPGANRLEFGFTDVRGIRTLPHPYARPAIANTEAAVERLLQERLG